MATEGEIGRVLAKIAGTLNDRKFEQFDRPRVQEIVTEALGGEPRLTVDDGGGLHDHSGVRVGAIRRTPSGEWITERQNELAERADRPIPREPEPNDSQGQR